ncbi:hypothetical protein CHS0354_010731 [Potamilus streckersoni]|uniref:Uncharacterized protein n=1 Tax=Potamilus streckersoni TaxID=2493646 RepID=A0AAE0SV06_9BIVA|nr:hypothetical protein CHS0354_010731 [Potamilus streckersoni]
MLSLRPVTLLIGRRTPTSRDFSIFGFERPCIGLVNYTDMPQVWKPRHLTIVKTIHFYKLKLSILTPYASVVKKDQQIGKTFENLLKDIQEPREDKGKEVGESNTSASSVQERSVYSTSVEKDKREEASQATSAEIKRLNGEQEKSKN